MCLQLRYSSEQTVKVACSVGDATVMHQVPPQAARHARCHHQIIRCQQVPCAKTTDQIKSLGAESAPHGKLEKHCSLPRAWARASGMRHLIDVAAPQHTRDKHISSKKLLKDRPRGMWHMLLCSFQIEPLQKDSQEPVVSNSLECPYKHKV